MSYLRLLNNVHIGTKHIGVNCNTGSEKISLVTGKYDYYHYLCDGVDDKGWGCGYRTLQTICSWINYNTSSKHKVPSIYEIQEVLINIHDKETSFLGSRQWIGSFEACLVINELYDVPCKILHVGKTEELTSITDTLLKHFQTLASPVMMGGDVDCSSKGVVGIHIGDNETYLLIVDPHYVGIEYTAEYLQSNSWVAWRPLSEFISNSFYNLCLPQVTVAK